MADVTKPDANPIAAALLSFFVFEIGHMVINGQQRKFLFSLVARIIGTFLCCIPGLVIHVLSAIDAYQTAERLQKGETIGENEYTYELLYKIVKLVDSTATFKGKPSA